jgi:hypothetical protein
MQYPGANRIAVYFTEKSGVQQPFPDVQHRHRTLPRPHFVQKNVLTIAETRAPAPTVGPAGNRYTSKVSIRPASRGQ